MLAFEELAAVGLAGGDLEGDDVALRWSGGVSHGSKSYFGRWWVSATYLSLIEKLNRDADRRSHFDDCLVGMLKESCCTECLVESLELG